MKLGTCYRTSSFNLVPSGSRQKAPFDSSARTCSVFIIGIEPGWPGRHPLLVETKREKWSSPSTTLLSGKNTQPICPYFHEMKYLPSLTAIYGCSEKKYSFFPEMLGPAQPEAITTKIAVKYLCMGLVAQRPSSGAPLFRVRWKALLGFLGSLALLPTTLVAKNRTIRRDFNIYVMPKRIERIVC